jgi:3-isopropylmalate dehydrogenase
MEKKHFRIAVFPGDGIGPEIVREALKCLEALSEKSEVSFHIQEGLIGGAAIDSVGIPLPDASLALARESHAVLLGAVGGPKWEHLPYEIRPERALLGLREKLGLFANLRPVKVYDELINSSPLKADVVSNTDIMIIRELTGDAYFGQPRGVLLEHGRRVGLNTIVYTEEEVRRIAKVAFESALGRRCKLCSVDKANVLESTQLWRDVVTEVGRDYPEVSLFHMYVDNCAMQLIRNPSQFDVIVTTNMFGDILSDEASVLAGSIGMLPSASLGENAALYEPIHGSAPDIAGQDKANPLGMILSVAMMLRISFGMNKEARLLEAAVAAVLQQGVRTSDIFQEGDIQVGTAGMGERVILSYVLLLKENGRH